MNYNNDWLQEYSKFTSGNEVPSLYHYWTAIGLIASVLRQNVWIDMGESFQTYPNMFIVIVDVAGAGKSHAIERYGLGLLEEADRIVENDDKLYIYNQRITSAAMIKSMSQLYKDRGVNCVTVFAEELGFFTDMSGDNSNISNVLIKTYDNGNLANETIARSLESIPHPQLNIIGGTTPGSLKESVGKRFIDAGVMSRLIFVHTEKVGEPRPFPISPKDNLNRKKYLASKLNEFKKLNGQFRWTQDARDAYMEWYIHKYQSSSAKEDKVLTKRVGNKMLKIAMVLSVAREHDLILTKEDILSAIDTYNEVVENYHYIHIRLNTSEVGRNTERILSKIKEAGEITRSDLLSKVRSWCETKDLERYVATLIDSNIIEEKHITMKKAKRPTTVYLWREK